jgi:hypothetical protein
MKKAVIQITGVTPYSPSRHYTAEVPKLKDETADQYDERTWRSHAHINEKKHIIIPSVCFSWALKEMAKRRGDRIPGKGQKTFTKAFEALEVIGDIDTKVKVDECECEAFMANADGVRGSGKRVLRRFPLVRQWGGTLTVILWNDLVTESVFGETVRDCGLLIGVGRRRPEKAGFFGRFCVDNITWHDRVEMTAVMADLGMGVSAH